MFHSYVKLPEGIFYALFRHLKYPKMAGYHPNSGNQRTSEGGHHPFHTLSNHQCPLEK